MTLSKIKKLKDERGFTIVELLIVIVVIAILAAIVIVAYNGIQNRAKTQSANASATVIQKKIEAYAAANSGNYPSATTIANYTTALNTYTESSISSSGITLGTPTGATGDEKKVEVSNCATVGATGYRVRFWDFGANPAAISATTLTGNLNSTSCVAWTPLT
jgi:prepilin-type N-terminal cleavage/methylation domain-containing protein